MNNPQGNTVSEVRASTVNAEMIAALIGLEAFFQRPGEGSNEAFERIGEIFHRETGYIRPGKDCVLHSPESRKREWDIWIEGKLTASREAIAKATGTTDTHRDSVNEQRAEGK